MFGLHLYLTVPFDMLLYALLVIFLQQKVCIYVAGLCVSVCLSVCSL